METAGTHTNVWIYLIICGFFLSREFINVRVFLFRVWLARLLNCFPPPVPHNSLVCFFSKLGIYQKAFEHLGNALIYDPTNYKVCWALLPQSLYIHGHTVLRDALTLKAF